MTPAMSPEELHALAHQLAERACVTDIETEAVAQTDEHGRRWYDTRPMLDPREMSDDLIEMNVQALAYAHQRGVISPHPLHAHLVRIVKAS